MIEHTAYRYAVYYAPAPDSPWWVAGSQWLGRCAAQGTALAQPTVPGLGATEFAALTSAPRRYGWHATLKAPFTLAAGMPHSALRATLHTLSGSLSSFAMPDLRVALLGDFLALVPHRDAQALQAVAAACVTQLQPLAAPLSEAELHRRRQAPLTPAQDQLLVRWGYPFVMDHFRFHCSLTGSLQCHGPTQIASVRSAAERMFHNLPASRFETLALFAQSAPGADFRLVEHFRLQP